MSRLALTAAAVTALFATGAVLGGCDCPKIQQDVYVATPDATLAPLIEACRSGIPMAGETCPSTNRVKTDIPCACLPLCRRVLQLIDQFSGDETLISCQLLRAGTATGDAGTGGAGAGGGGAGGAGPTNALPVSSRAGTVWVAVTYRPSTCE